MEKKEEEPKYKKFIRKIKSFLDKNLKNILIFVLIISIIEFLYINVFTNPDSKIHTRGNVNLVLGEMQMGGNRITQAPFKLGRGLVSGFKKLPDAGKKIMNTNLLTKVFYGLWLVIKNLLTLLLFVFIFMAIPLIPILIFMLIMFFILRNRVGSLKQL